MAANMWDNSNILLSSTVGQSLGGGLAAVGHGVAEYRKKQKEKEAEAAAVEWLAKNGQGMGLNTQDEGELKAAVKAFGGGPQAVQMISGLEQQKSQRAMQAQQMQLTQAQLKGYEAGQQAALRSSGAVQLAAGGNANRDQAAAILQGGGNFQSLTPSAPGGNSSTVTLDALRRGAAVGDATDLGKTLGTLESLHRKEQPFTPAVVDLGNGRQAMTTSASSAVPLTPPKTAKDDLTPIEIGGKKYFVGPGNHYFDDNGKPVQLGADRPPVPPSFETKAIDPDLYNAQREVYLDWAAQRGAGSSPAATTLPSEIPGGRAGGGPVEVFTQAELEKLPPGADFVWIYPDGTRKRGNKK